KEYRRADGERASLQHALALLSNLLKRQPNAERPRVVSPKARFVSRLFDQAPFAAVLCDADRKVTAWNAAAEQLFGIPLAEAVGMKGRGETPSEWLDRIHPADRDSVEKGIRAHVEGAAPRFESEHRLRHEDGSWRWVLSRGQATRDPAGKALRLSGSMMDVTDPKLTTVRVLHDALTRLPNRAHFIDVLRRAFARVRRREGAGIGVLIVDVDDFRSMNARLGHEGGDEILIQVVERLQTCLGEGDVLARLGADEFAVLLEDLSGSGAAEMVASRI